MSVFFYGCITMDGYLAGKNHGLEWLYETGGAEETDYGRFYRTMDITLMGRRTFAQIERLEDAGSVYPTTQNYVFTHDDRLSRAGFTPVSGNIPAFVKRLGTTKNIWVIGGSTILAPLLDEGMVDCLVLQVAPVLLGAGIPLFAQKERLRRFRLDEVKRYGQFAELVFSRGDGRTSG